MIAEGALQNPAVDAVVGLHISQGEEVGYASFRPLGLMASAQRFDVEIVGSQTHGAGLGLAWIPLLSVRRSSTDCRPLSVGKWTLRSTRWW